ncbi:extracellular electron transfer flavoprotein PplA [Vagococcus xieshaowenii]|uniref:FMN-binding protein n=1 Tax=Vagococcus xieshaowenii TaxID=2562451 RepID=A0AAJ5JQT7_9ENTE|nr:extracellular electron transfer flavoprotein PplA [Vagococcus xieshaowenii]QCA27833.1 FMN-binding protein [Vagococcus xieshaowenii]TFZ42668.1 FMN-binding protein [Vagococcus xieshaowenii]
MKKTKLLSGMAVAAMATLLLAGCSSDQEKETTKESSATTEQTSSSAATEETAAEKVAGADLQDGTYKLEEKNESNGYRAVFSIDVKDGKITASNFDYVDADGNSKKDDKDYNTNMKDKAGVSPAEFIPALNDAFVAAQSADVEAVTGATHSSHSFVNYAQQLIQAAQAGNTETIEINNGADLVDGTYNLEEKNESNGYRVVFSIDVKDGKISASNFDYVNADGKSKKDDADYNKMMEEKSGVGPATFIPELNESLVKAESVGDVEVVTGATHSSHNFQTYAQQLVNAAEKGDTAKIEVDNIVMAK